MQLELVPLLEVQRELYRMPRGMDRFRAYLRTLSDETTGDVGLPLGWMNPMGKEHVCMARAGSRGPKLDLEDLIYTREVVGPYLDARDQPTIAACLFGDETARSLGYPPLGLSERAGFALALADAR